MNNNENQEKNLFDALTDIKEEYIEEAAVTKLKKKISFKNSWKIWSITAAVITAVIVLPFMLTDQPKITDDDNQGSSDIIAYKPITKVKNLSRELPDDYLIKSITPLKASGIVIENDTSFTIETRGDITAEELSLLLKTEPVERFEIDENADGSFVLNLNQTLPSDSAVRLTLLDENGDKEKSWAFQTSDVYRITSTIPANESMYVPENSGIEFNFSQHTETAELEKYFEITPEVKGHFEKIRSTLIFVPDEDMKQNTVYTVTVKAGLPSKTGDILNEDLTLCFKTSKLSTEYCYVTNGISESFIPGDPLVVEFLCSSFLLDKEFSVKLYQYSGAEEYKNALLGYSSGKRWEEDYIFPTNGLKVVYTAEDVPLRKESAYDYYYAPTFLMLPDDLTEGYYLADIFSYDENFHMQKLIQINPLSVYASILPTEAALFINDTKTGEAAANAVVTVETGKNVTNAVVSDDGIAHIETKTDGKSSSYKTYYYDYIYSNNYQTGIISIDYGDYLYLDLFDARTENERSPSEDFYLYIYTDRETYLQTDTINVWGVVLPRFKNAVMPSDLNLMLGSNEAEGGVVPVALNADGTFTASISYENRAASWDYLRLRSGDSELLSKWLTIRDYDKPEYIIDLDVPLFSWLPQDNPVDISANISYYDGTPAEGLEVVLTNYNSFNNSIQTVTDKNGNANGKISSNVDYENSWYPSSFNVECIVESVENNYQRAYGIISAFYRDTMLEYEVTSDKLEIKTSMIDTSRIKTDEQINNMWYNLYYKDKATYDLLRGKPVDIEVKATVTRYWTEQNETGSYYDFINKINVKTYEYIQREEIAGSYILNTVNGECVLENLNMTDKEGHYNIDLTWKDSGGRIVTETIYFSEKSIDYYYNNTDRLSFRFSTDSNTFTEDGIINFELNEGYKSENYKDPDGKIFYAVNGFNFITLDAVTGTEFALVTPDSYIPTFYISGAYFDGKHVYPIEPSYFSFDPKEREIILDVSPDKDSYSPAEKANITVIARDINGKVIPDATVSLSIVDEAAFALSEQNADSLNALYADTPIPYATNYFSYKQHSLDPSPGSERGGGGPSAVRKDFKDTAAFLSGITDKDGKITFDIKLPDNITTWRATVQAVGNNENNKLCAGTAKEYIVSSLPFFITPIMLSEYTEGDDFTATVKTTGSKSEDVLITAELKGDNYNSTVSGNAKDNLEFGKLPKGEYTVLFTGTDGINSDAVELPVKISETQLETTVTRSFNLKNGLPEIYAVRYPVTVMFYDNEYKLYGEILNKLYSGGLNSRADFRIAQEFAKYELGYQSKEDYIHNVSAYTMGGLLQIFPYSEQDYVLTSLVCAAAPEVLNADLTADMLYQKLNSLDADSETVTACLMGLAALSKPVLTDIYDLLLNADELSYHDKLRLCAALALAGDYDGARGYYAEFTAADIVIYYEPKINANIARLGDSGNEQSIADTSLAIITASILNLPEAEGMSNYLMNNKSAEQTLVLEFMTYLKNYVPKTSGNAVFSYNLNGKTETLELNRFRGTAIKFGKEQLENADFKIVSGDIACTVYYTGGLNEQEKEPVLNLKKDITVIGGEAKVGALVRISLILEKGTKPDYYQVEDIIPSCMRFVSATSGYYVERSGQNISTGIMYQITGGAGGISSDRVIYYARIVSRGEYINESAFVRNYSGEYGNSERGIFTSAQ